MTGNRRLAPGTTTALIALALVLSGAGMAAIAAPSAASAGDRERCDRPLDVMFTVDTSNSMRNTFADGTRRIDVARQGAASLAEQLSPKDTSGVVDFSREYTLQKSLDGDHGPVGDSGSTANVLANLQIDWPNGQTWTDKGIERSQQELDDNGRAGVPNVMILLTDGLPYPSWRQNPTLQAAEDAKQAGTELFVVDIGQGNPSLMKQVASDPDENHYFPASSSEAVLDALDAIRDNIYQGEVIGESYAVKAEAGAADAQVTVDKVNHQLLPPGEAGTVERVTVTTSNPPLEIVADVARGATDGTTSVHSAKAHANVTIHGLEVTDRAASQTLVSLDVLRSESYSHATPTDAGSSDGDTALAELSVLGTSKAATVPPNTVVPLAGYGTLALNEQIHRTQPGMSSLRVNAVHLELDTGSPGASTDVVVGSAFSGAYCGVQEDAEIEDGDEDGPVDVDVPGTGADPCDFTTSPAGCPPGNETPCVDPNGTIDCHPRLPCLALPGAHLCPGHLFDVNPRPA